MAQAQKTSIEHFRLSPLLFSPMRLSLTESDRKSSAPYSCRCTPCGSAGSNDFRISSHSLACKSQFCFAKVASRPGEAMRAAEDEDEPARTSGRAGSRGHESRPARHRPDKGICGTENEKAAAPLALAAIISRHEATTSFALVSILTVPHDPGPVCWQSS